MYERSDDDGFSDSKSNENEATLVTKHLERLIAAGVNPSSMSIISPYQAQVALLTAQLRSQYPELEIGSVDGFQGRENDVVIISLVRSNDKVSLKACKMSGSLIFVQREVGFLKDSRRLNVAMTRPRRQLVVVGDSSTVAEGAKFLKSWMSWLEENADLQLAGMDG